MKDIATHKTTDDIESEIARLVPRHNIAASMAAASVRSNVASYADAIGHEIPASKVENIGRLSAEAVQKQYEAAAEEVKTMGVVIKERIQRLEQCLQECDNDLKVISEMSQAIVEKGQHVAAEIEHTNAVANDIRTACADFQKKVGGGKS
jgi:ferritin-like metal-binding protein YciE